MEVLSLAKDTTKTIKLMILCFNTIQFWQGLQERSNTSAGSATIQDVLTALSLNYADMAYTFVSSTSLLTAIERFMPTSAPPLLTLTPTMWARA